MDAKKKIQIRYIIMEREDGPDSRTIRIPHTFRGFRAADNYLKEEALSAPKAEDQADEIAFTVVFMDGDTYSGTYHLRRSDAYLTRNLSPHIRQYAEWFSGRATKPACGPEKYAELVETYTKRGMVEKFSTLLDNYDVGY